MSDRSRNLLHVDDDPDMLRLVACKLRPRGFQVHSLDDPRQAQRELLSHDCRVVLLDVDMPTINGLELLRQIKRHDGGIQVILLTGLLSTNTVLESMRMGAEACLFKPIHDFDELYEVLDATCAKVGRWWRTLQDLADRSRAQTPPTRTVVG
jgi:DNA-binding NtrC family response regulator